MEPKWLIEVESVNGTVKAFADVSFECVDVLFGELENFGAVEIPAFPWARNVLVLASPHTQWVRGRPVPVVNTGTVIPVAEIGSTVSAPIVGLVMGQW